MPVRACCVCLWHQGQQARGFVVRTCMSRSVCRWFVSVCISMGGHIKIKYISEDQGNREEGGGEKCVDECVGCGAPSSFGWLVVGK